MPKMQIQRIGVLTGGGDCPGLNAAIRAVVRRSLRHGWEVYGILEGFYGLMEGKVRNLTFDSVSGILPVGGTILGSSRINPLAQQEGIRKILENAEEMGLDGVIAIGGEGTLRIALALHKAGLPVVVVPKTIDNDVVGTDFTIGFDTAVHVAVEAIDRLTTTAESHNRVMLVEVMGRHAGWIATAAGIAGGAEAILVPEHAFKLSELVKLIEGRRLRGRRFSIVVVSEDAKVVLDMARLKGALRSPTRKDEYGEVKMGGIAELLASKLRKVIDSDVRTVVLGHVQRGGTPTAYDRVLATRLGVFGADLVQQQKFGTMAALQGNRLVSVPLTKTAGKVKKVDPEFYKISQVFQVP